VDRQTILDIIEAMGLDVRRAKVSKDHLQMLCPLHDDSDPSFSVFLTAGGSWMCFGCGSSGHHMGELIREIEQIRGPQPKARELWTKDKRAYLKAKGILKDEASSQSTPLTPEQELAAMESRLLAMEWEGTKGRDDRLRYEYTPLPEGDYRVVSIRPARYFLERGFTERTCEYWNLGDDQSMQRALIPIRDFQGVLVGAQGRSYAINCKCGFRFDQWVKHPDAVKTKAGKVKRCPVCTETPPIKYLTTAGFEKSLFLFGEHMIDRDRKEAIIVESPMSVLWLWQHGYPNALATMGSIPSEHQIRKIRTWFHSVFLFADGDPKTHPNLPPAGERWRSHLFASLGRYLTVRHRTCPTGKDPADLPLGTLREVLGDPPGVNPDIRTRAKDDPGRQSVLLYV
jgi:hypothetical protein